MKKNKTIFIECKAPFMHITINRPKVLNALNSEAHLLLHEAFNRFEKNNELQIATITGTGGSILLYGNRLEREI